jgi:hypothetical protein
MSRSRNGAVGVTSYTTRRANTTRGVIQFPVLILHLGQERDSAAAFAGTDSPAKVETTPQTSDAGDLKQKSPRHSFRAYFPSLRPATKIVSDQDLNSPPTAVVVRSSAV